MLPSILSQRPRRAPGALLLAGLLIAGCATRAPLPTRADAPPAPAPATATDSWQMAGTTTLEAADSRASPDAIPEPDYVPHEWPDPEQDLWARIRAGFKLEAHARRRDVREWTQFYATHRADLDTSLIRAKPFLWHIVDEIERRDMPLEIALLPIVESGYNPSARSYVGASGLWQFMPGTADHMGLTRDWWYDGRNDVIASTRAALDYLQRLNDRYDGDWLLALAAYNAGPGRVSAALARIESEGLTPSFWELELPRETLEYVPRLLAVRRIMRTPARFGFDWPQLDTTPRTRSVELPSQIELAVAARMLDMPEAELRRLNPGLRRWASGPDGDYTLLVPAARAAPFRRRLAAAKPATLITRRTHVVRRGDVLGTIARRYGVSIASLRQANQLASDRILVGQRLQIARSDTLGPAPSPAGPSQRYVVQSGDTLWAIARRYNADPADLKRANKGDTTLRPGQSLRIPGTATSPAPSTHVVDNGDSLWSVAHANEIAVADLRRWNRLGGDTTLQPGHELAIDGPAPLPDYYEVTAGDSLWSIANRFRMDVTTLRSLNDMATGSTIRVGQRLRLQPGVSG